MNINLTFDQPVNTLPAGFVASINAVVQFLDSHFNNPVTINIDVAEEWGRLSVPNPIAVIDGLLAATAKVHGLTLVTRNVSDVARTGVASLNPWLK